MDFRVNKKVVIDAYRGGDDIGSSANGIIEKDYNLDISNYIYDRLKSLGIPVSITRNSDETLDMKNRVNRIKSFYSKIERGYMKKWYICPYCEKKIAKYQKDANSKGVFLLCKNCKKEIEIIINNKE